MSEQLSLFNPVTNHRGASRGAREMANWDPETVSPQSEMEDEREVLVNRAQDMERNNGFAAGAIQTDIDNVVGTGLKLRARPEWEILGKTQEWADKFSESVERRFDLYACEPTFDSAGRNNFYDQTAQVEYYGLSNGEYLALPMWTPNRAEYNTSFMMVDPIRLETPDHKPDSERMKEGFELNKYGEAKAAWIRRQHPGDSLVKKRIDPGRRQWLRVPMATQINDSYRRPRVLHSCLGYRAGLLRGKPFLAPILSELRTSTLHTNAAFQKQIVTSLIAAFVQTPMDQETILKVFSHGANGEKLSAADSTKNYLRARASWDAELAGGSIIQMMPGDEMKPFAPSQTDQNFDPFTKHILNKIAVGLNFPKELLTKDWTETNYSSARAGLLEVWRHFAGKREWLANRWCRPVYRLWLEEAVNRGEIDGVTPAFFYRNFAALTKSQWVGPGRGYVDPDKEKKSYVTGLAGGFDTLDDIITTQGGDLRTVIAQRGREKRMAEKEGLTLEELMPAVYQAQQEEPDSGDEEETPPSKAKPKGKKDE